MLSNLIKMHRFNKKEWIIINDINILKKWWLPTSSDVTNQSSFIFSCFLWRKRSKRSKRSRKIKPVWSFFTTVQNVQTVQTVQIVQNKIRSSCTHVIRSLNALNALNVLNALLWTVWTVWTLVSTSLKEKFNKNIELKL